MGERIIEPGMTTRSGHQSKSTGSRWIAIALVASAGLLARADKPRVPTPVNAATSYPLHETHAAEHVTIAVEPGDTDDTNPKTRLDYLHHGYMPLRIIVTNDSDQAVELDEARILFVGADNSVTNSATEDDMQRRMFTMKQVQPTKIPIVPITIHHEQVDSKIVKDMDDFGFVTTRVAPHSTAGGWLFYDVRDLEDPVLERSTLELRKVRFVGSTGKTLDTFMIPLKPTPALKKDDKAKEAAEAGKNNDKIKPQEFAGRQGTR